MSVVITFGHQICEFIFMPLLLKVGSHACSAIVIGPPDPTVYPICMEDQQNMWKYASLVIPVLDLDGQLIIIGLLCSMTDLPPVNDGT